MNERWERIEKLYHAARELDRDQQARFLDEACRSDAEMRRQIDDLLKHDQEGSFLNTPAIEFAARVSPGSSLPPNTRIGPYEVIGAIGKGGMGEVYRARDFKLERDVAIKILPPAFAVDSNRVSRFGREARMLAALNHPNIGAIYGVEESGGAPSLILELVEGPTLSDVVAEGPLPLDDALTVGRQIAKAIEAAHEKGILHRDLKPENIKLRADGVVKVLDFGLAKAFAGDSPTIDASDSQGVTVDDTESSLILGTAAYMSPEQARGKPLDKRADIWSFGCVLYEMLTGQRAFAGETVSDTMAAILGREPDWRALPDKTPPNVRRLLQRCLEKDPRRRLRDIGDVRLEIEHALAVDLDPPAGRTGVSPVLIEQSTSIRKPRPRPIVRWMAPAITALAVAGVAVWWGNKLTPRAASQPIRSIAVLPLRNLSRDPEQEFFADGTTEALISNLAQIHALKVISRSSVMRYSGTTKPMLEISRELGVDAVVEGSVQRAGDRVRITAQLIQASTDRHLWANEYERDIADVLTLEGEVARAIAQEIRIQVTSDEHNRMAGARRINPAAEEAYLLGRYHRWKLNEQDLRQGIDYFEQAVKLQPDFAAAYAGLATVWHERGVWGAKGFREVEEPARRAALKALELDPNLSEAHTALANELFSYDWNWSGAEREHQRALDLDSNNVDERVYYAMFLMALGRHQEAVAQIERAAALDPLSSDVQSNFGRVLFRARKFDEAVPHFLRAIELDSQNYGAYTRLAEVYEQTGKLHEALALIEQSLRIRGADLTKSVALGRIYALVGRRREALQVIEHVTSPGSNPAGQDLALIYFALGDNDLGFQWLTRAFDQRELVVYVKVDPRFDSVRPDPRFQALVRRLGMPDLPR